MEIWSADGAVASGGQSHFAELIRSGGNRRNQRVGEAWKITFPLVSPTILVVIIYSIIDSFTDYSNSMMRMINDQFAAGYYEYSTAIGLVYFVIVLILVGIVNLIISKRVFYATL